MAVLTARLGISQVCRRVHDRVVVMMMMMMMMTMTLLAARGVDSALYRIASSQCSITYASVWPAVSRLGSR